MAEALKKIDPSKNKGSSEEVSDVDVPKGVYVFQPTDEYDNKIGDKVYQEALNQPQAEAFLHLGYRGASDEEAKEYKARVKQTLEENRKLILEDEKTRKESK